MKTAILLCLLLLWGQPARSIEITSLQPGAARPESPVIMTVSDPPPTLTLQFGETSVTTRPIAPGVFQFQVPPLPPGDYSVAITAPGQTTPAPPPFWFQILATPPDISALTPDTFSFCRGGGPEELDIEGTGFAAAATVLLDGSRIPVTSRSPGHLRLQLPPLPAGLHKIQVANPDEQVSLPVTLSVVQQPVIHRITTGGDAITSYQLSISGENFVPESQLLLNGTPLPGRRSDLQSGDRVSYLDCTTLLYQRFPVSGQLQDLEFRVVNPDGQVSNSYSISGY